MYDETKEDNEILTPRYKLKYICETICFIGILILIGFMAYNNYDYWGWLILLLFMF